MLPLLDVNVVIALSDPNHIHARTAHEWLNSAPSRRWATCAIVLNGALRVMSHPAFSRQGGIANTAAALRQTLKNSNPVVWSESISILDESVFNHSEILSPKQLTDAYLLALAVKNGGTLVTFDRKLRLQSVVDAEPWNLTLLGAVSRQSQ